jgi:uncharacterized protein
MSLLLLALSIGGLIVGPVLYGLASRRRVVLNFLDGFVLVAICGLLIVTVLPQSIHELGWSAVVAALAGVLFPLLFERSGDDHGRRAVLPILIPAVLGLMAHATLDGVMLSQAGAHAAHAHGGEHGHDGGSMAIALAVVLHRLPVGIALWAVTRRTFGTGYAVAVIAGIAVFTGVGFAVAAPLAGAGGSLPLLQAFMAGALLHVVIHRPEPGDARDHGRDHSQGHSQGHSHSLGHDPGHAPGSAHVGAHGPMSQWPWAEVAGGAVAGVVLWLLPHSHTPVDWATYGERIVSVALQGAPILLGGHLLAGLVVALLPRRPRAWLGRGSTLGQALRGVVAGAPLPLCSCGIAPVYRGLIKCGVPATAALALLLATPEIGVESILLTWVLLGAPLTLARLVAAGVLALLIGWLVGRIVKGVASGDCASLDDEPRPPPLLQRLGRAIPYGFGDVVHDTAPWLLLGLAAAAAGPWLRAIGAFSTWPMGLDVLVFALVGIAIYVCASAATPIAAMMILLGVSPGAALAFLLAGPATNVSTYRVLTELHSRRVAMFVAVSVLAAAVALGMGLNLVFPNPFGTVISPQVGAARPWYQWASLGLLTAAFALTILQLGPRRLVDTVLHLGRPDHHHDQDQPHHGHAHYCCAPEDDHDHDPEDDHDHAKHDH